jgi:hypothetical protein
MHSYSVLILNGFTFFNNLISCFMNRITKTLAVTGLVLPIITSSCKKDSLADNQSISNQHNEAKIDQHNLQRLLVKGLAPSLGSTIGPGGDLFVPDPLTGSILRINPKTGDYTTFASGLPLKVLPDIGLGGIHDVAFLGRKAYALVTMVDDPLFPTGQVNGIYRIDGPNSYTIIADIGAYNIAHPPTRGFAIDVVTGVSYAMENYRDGFLVTDGHFNRVLYVTLDGKITIVKRFKDIVPTGLAVRDNVVYMSEAGPVPHLPKNGKVVSFSHNSPQVTKVASGAPLLVDVEFGRGKTLFALSQGQYSGDPEGSPALPNTGSLVRVKADGTFSVIADELDRPTSFEIIGNTAYIVTLAGEIWTVDNIVCPPSDQHHQKRLLHRHG